MAGLGFFLGGLAQGYNQASESATRANFLSQELKLKQQALQQQKERETFARNDKFRSDLWDQISQGVESLKIAGHSTQEIAAGFQGPMQQLKRFAESSGVANASAVYDAQFASLLAKPSAAVTEAAMARAKEGPLSTALKQSEIRKNNATAATAEVITGAGPNPDSPAPGTGLGTGKPPAGDAALPSGSTPAQSSGLITTPMSDNQKRIVDAAGMTAQTADFEAVKYAFGGDLPAARSKVGGYASNIIRSRGDQYWIDRGVDPQAANAIRVEFKAMQHGASKIADIDARMTTAVAKAQQTAQILTGESGQNLIGDVSRTKFKNLNDLIVAAKERTGNQSEIRLGIALETLASNYGVALGMGNSTLTDFQTQRAQNLLQQGWTKGQLSAAIDQLQKEMVREEAGSRMALKTYIGGMQSTMGTNPGQTPGQSNTPPPPAGFNVLGQ